MKLSRPPGHSSRLTAECRTMSLTSRMVGNRETVRKRGSGKFGPDRQTFARNMRNRGDKFDLTN
jgi:hypothetical protein